jgi:hypothetical protein
MAWQGNGMGMAWEQQGMCELALSWSGKTVLLEGIEMFDLL